MKDLQITLKERFAKAEINEFEITWLSENGIVNLEKIADDYAIEFAKWCRGNYDFIKKEDYTILLKKFKKEKGL
jgi:hypothetical protein